MKRAWIKPPSSVVLKVSGKDARRYLNNRLSNDLRNLAPGSVTAAAALTPQGKVEGLFTVFCDADDRFYLACDGGVRQAIFAALGRYIVADRVSIEDISSSADMIHVSGEREEISAELSSLGSDLVDYRLGVSPLSALGCVLVVLSGSAETARVAEMWGEPISQEQYHAQRFSGGFPQYPTEVNEEVILTECKLASAVSFSKGCYVGQEVIERSDAIGRLPRHLERIVLQGLEAPQPGASVIGSDGTVIGKVVSSLAELQRKRVLVFALLRTGRYTAADSVTCGALSGAVLSSEETTI
jgi:folate-binding protein YgfZ